MLGGWLGGDQEHTFYSSPALNLNIKISIDNNSNYHPYEPKNLDNNEYVFKGDITISFNDIFNTLKQYNLQDKYYLTINESEPITNKNYRRTGYKLPSGVYANNNKYYIELWTNYKNNPKRLNTVWIWIKKSITTPDDIFFSGCINNPNKSYNVYFKNDQYEKEIQLYISLSR